MKKVQVLPLLFIWVVTGCASAPRGVDVSIPQDHFSEVGAGPVPLVMNDRVQDWINFFQGPGRERFERYLSRSRKYIPMMRKILRHYGLPGDLVYLAMIESGFNPHAYSRARATGTWQFIYRTGLRYGLRVDSWIDERRDPEKSTVAAAKYLKDLYDQFNDWYLAAAGYNAGEGKIHRAIKKYRTEDYWEMSRQRYLKSETKNYVPKMIAAALISKDPEKYGFAHVRYEEPVAFETVAIDTPTDLRTAAGCAGARYEEIKGLNPELLTWVTPPFYADYPLKVPAGSAEKFRVRYAALTPEERIAERAHEVKAGESFKSLAVRNGMPVKFLAAVNGFASDTRLKPGQTVLIPREAPEGERFRGEGPSRGRMGSGTLAYRVRRGDTLQRIGRRLGLRASELKRLNPDVAWQDLKYGRTLHLATGSAGGTGGTPKVKTVASAGVAPAPSSPAALAAPAALAVPEDFVTHTVQAGETLWEIARKYNVTVREIKEWNQVVYHRRLRPGKSLRIRVRAPSLASAK